MTNIKTGTKIRLPKPFIVTAFTTYGGAYAWCVDYKNYRVYGNTQQAATDKMNQCLLDEGFAIQSIVRSVYEADLQYRLIN